MANDSDDQNNNPKPRCVAEVIQRVAQGTTTKSDADYLLEVLNFAGARIGALETKVAWLQRQLAARLH